ncbi:uncharacterized protein PAC_01668 [Phialocephala subalpina]|uniref:Heterokaryon incompatibility domain-containing protein n=1 Tax=Phialocephala subalpina TaxID=576137 RepID=A0A1L7WG98_9HELO|nr:uncharacterized protein PAC_01668 [Phialocephala subalpina]
MSADGPATLPLYQHLPLSQTDSIRLIELQPSQHRGAPIRCNLIHTTLSQIERDIVDHYTALSYVWGDATDTIDILVDQDQRLRVTVSLECALRHVRDAKRTFCVWADGACINQDDMEERNQQVRQMGSIYSLATHTVIFLGVDESIMQDFVKLLNPRLAGQDFESVPAALDVLKSPWFYRIWIYQELVMSRDPWVQSRVSVYEIQGSSSTSPETCGLFRDRASYAKSRQSYQRTLLSKMRLYGVDRSVAFQNFTDTLAARRGFGVSDPRDMIFAHLGLMRNTDIQADYGQSTKHVYQNFARHQMEETCSLELLGHVEDVPLERRKPGIPSWAPDWTIRSLNVQPINRDLPDNNVRKRPLKPFHELLRNVSYREWSDFQTFRFQMPQKQHLCCFGLHFCQLDDISSILDDIDNDPNLAALRAWDPREDNFACLLKYLSKKIGKVVKLQPTFFKPRSDRSPPEVYFRTTESAMHADSVMEILAMRFRTGRKLQPAPSIVDGFKFGPSAAIDPAPIDAVPAPRKELSSILEGRKIASTGHGLAIVPSSTLPGDIIYILRGSRIPVVLREIQNGVPSELDGGIRNTLGNSTPLFELLETDMLTPNFLVQASWQIIMSRPSMYDSSADVS